MRSPTPAQLVLLVILLLLLAVQSYLIESNQRHRTGDASVEDQLRAIISAKTAYFLQAEYPFVGTVANASDSKLPANTIRSLQNAAHLTHGVPAYRRLIIISYALHQPEWRAAIREIPHAIRIGQKLPLPQEMYFWQTVYNQPHIKLSQVPELTHLLAEMRLGWYSHLALETIYRKSGDKQQAASEHEAAVTDGMIIMRLSLFGLLGIISGSAVGFGVLIWFIIEIRRPPEARSRFWRWVVQQRSSVASRPAVSRLLYNTFILYLCIFALLRALLPFIISRSFKLNLQTSVRANVLLSVSLEILVPVVAGAYFITKGRAMGLRFADLGWTSRHPLGDIFCAGVLYWGLMPFILLAQAIAQYLLRGIPTPLHPLIGQLMANQSTLIALTLLLEASVLAPFVEELMFRGCLFGSLRQRMGVYWAIIISSAIFAGLHPQLPLGFISLFLIGCALAALYHVRSSLLASMSFHAINNAIVTLYLLAVVRP
ncbi:MAG: CPBP family intramembrane metalloprotease [Armatimonadetes bacterium]|nr:CPBP family intramembrane metalloprotease [Armatimonadota bacterium]